MYLTNKVQEGSISLPAQSSEANFFQEIQPLVQGEIFKVGKTV
jgi:hypothetical protein